MVLSMGVCCGKLRVRVSAEAVLCEERLLVFEVASNALQHGLERLPRSPGGQLAKDPGALGVLGVHGGHLDGVDVQGLVDDGLVQAPTSAIATPGAIAAAAGTSALRAARCSGLTAAVGLAAARTAAPGRAAAGTTLPIGARSVPALPVGASLRSAAAGAALSGVAAAFVHDWRHPPHRGHRYSHHPSAQRAAHEAEVHGRPLDLHTHALRALQVRPLWRRLLQHDVLAGTNFRRRPSGADCVQQGLYVIEGQVPHLHEGRGSGRHEPVLAVQDDEASAAQLPICRHVLVVIDEAVDAMT
mmetsp:Transcript_18905/g.53877  ORF Transcript_18905/g.53877 Transcript_18905/m.53877 type:complete len:300 (+) Transcript_18905:611-1510(+)